MKSKNYSYQVKDVTDKGIVTIAISKFDNIDGVGDIIRKGAFTKTFKEGKNRIKHLIDHKFNYENIVGLPLNMVETDSHAIIESALNLDIQKGKDLYSNYKFFAEHGKTLEHSIGYSTVKTNKNTEIRGEDISELKLYEYSTVNWGANSETPLVDLKSINNIEDVLLNIEQLTRHINKGDITDEQGKNIESLINTLKTYIEPLDALKEINYINVFKNIL